jgi:DNA-binding transcriptional ArsR family regulator
LTNPKRLEIVHSLHERGRLCAADLIDALGLSKTNLSQHMRVLRTTGIVEAEREHTQVCYRLASPRIGDPPIVPGRAPRAQDRAYHREETTMRNRAAEVRLSHTGADHVRESTSDETNERLDRAMRERVRECARIGPEAVSRRIEELEREWDIESYLAMNASALAATGVLRGAVHSRRWLVAPAVVLPFLFQHAVQGWCPPVPLFRRLGVRTRREIEQERYALKAVRGDFDEIAEGEPAPPERAARAIDGVRA